MQRTQKAAPLIILLGGAWYNVRTSLTLFGIIYLQKKERIMTWRGTTTMKQKIEFITEWRSGNYTITEFCRQFEI